MPFKPGLNNLKYILILLIFFPGILIGQRELSDSYFHRADSLIKEGKYQESLEVYKLYIDTEINADVPNWDTLSDVYNNSGVCYYVLRDFEKAAEAFKIALKIDREQGHETESERLSNLGMVYKKQGFYEEAISLFEEALVLAQLELNDPHDAETKALIRKNISKFLNNIGALYDSWSKYDKAIDYYERSLRIKEEMNDLEGISISLSNIGLVYNAWGKYDQAITNYREALLIDIEQGNKEHMAIRLNNIGLSFSKMREYDSALAYYQSALDLNVELGYNDQVATQYNNIGKVYIEKRDYAKANNYLKLALKIYDELNINPELAMVLLNLGENEMENGNYKMAMSYLEESIAISEEFDFTYQLQLDYVVLADIYSHMEKYDQALQYYKMANNIKDSLFTQDTHEQIADFEVKYDTERKEKEIEILRRQQIIRERLNYALMSIAILFFLLAGVIFWSLRIRIKDNRVIQREKMKSDRLLLNILPAKVATDLKDIGSTIPESFENATILFTDLVDFTEISSSLEPEFIINELNNMFSHFDAIIEKYGCERIKTIGDSYMAASGVPERDPDHAMNIVNAATEILQFMVERKKLSPVKWDIRIGIHSGSVVAGVVGVKKYIYDVFGDTVNTASRMESHSLPMRINVSESTYNLLKDEFAFEEREAIEIKGKGKLRMFLLHNKIRG